jgi:metallo-beta-lactamase family protein
MKAILLLTDFSPAATSPGEIKIFGHYYPVKAHIENINALSAHADQSELLHWLRNFQTKPKKLFLVHGEPCAMEALRIKIKDTLGVEPVIMEPEKPVILFPTGKLRELAM